MQLSYAQMTNQTHPPSPETYRSDPPAVATLPVGERLGLRFHSAQDIPEALSAGLPLESLTRLGEQLGLSQAETLNLVAISEASLRRRRKQGHFTSEESERLYRFADLLQAVQELFEDEGAAVGWLKRPRAYFQDRTPLEVARSEYGARKVLEFIAQLEVGAYV